MNLVKNLLIAIISTALLISSSSCVSTNYDNRGSSKNYKRYKIRKSTTNYSRNRHRDKRVNDADLPFLDKAMLNENNEYTGYFKIGKPYTIAGIDYFPHDYEDFTQIGTSSWYGEKFNGKLTANGEIYNMNSLTAAHRTLPLPSIVRVTNLKNGKSAIVRVNDRGPFAKERVIDLSKRVAKILGFQHQGTTRVRIKLLRKRTDQLLEKLKLKN